MNYKLITEIFQEWLLIGYNWYNFHHFDNKAKLENN